LGLGTNGTVEASIDPAGSAPEEMIAGRDKPGGLWASHRLAASSTYLVAAGPAFSVSWRKLSEPGLSSESFDLIQAIDAHDNRLAVVGARRDEKGRFAPEGAIAWIGSLDKRLADLRPVLYDAAGPGAPTMNRCGAAPLGSVRFLADGSLAVVPGVQPGVGLYNARGKLIHTWDTTSLGIDTDCASLSEEQARHLAASSKERQAWVNQRRTVDTLLPLRQGLGLIVRHVEKGHARWDLKLLRRDRAAQSYSIPVEGGNDSCYLQGDVRAGRLVLLIHEMLASGIGRSHPIAPRLILAEAP
jgi:hypothetical protein